MGQGHQLSPGFGMWLQAEVSQRSLIISKCLQKEVLPVTELGLLVLWGAAG